MTCAKRRVICILSDDDGRVASGENICNNPQDVCPREPGEGYEKCKSVCDQPAHAEIDALQRWEEFHGLEATPTHALIRGHEYCCDHCKEMVLAAGVKTIQFGEKNIK